MHMKIINLRKYAILLLFLTGLVLFHKFGYIGHYGYDDLAYAQIAQDFQQGVIDFEDHFTYRAPVVFATALSYSIFGVSDFASAIPALAISILMLLILFFIVKDKDWKTILVTLSLTTFSTWFIFYSDKLSADIYVAFFIFASLAVLHKYKYNSTKKRTLLYAFLFAAALFCAFLAKEVVILTAPLLLYIFIWDFIHKQDRKFWIYSILWGGILLIAYFIIIWALTGNFLKRFDAIINNSYLNLCSYDQQSLKILLKRIAWDFLDMCVYQNIIIGFVFVLAFMFQKKVLDYFKLKDSFSFFFVSSVILILSCNFMTISFTSYSPMCIDPRHYLYLIPIVSIPASVIISQFLEEKKYKIPIIIILAGVSVIAYFSQNDIFSKLYLPVLLLFCTYLFFPAKKIFQILFVVILVIILSLQPVQIIKYAQKVQYGKQKEIIFENIIQKNEECCVVTNEVQKRLGNYYTKFNPNSLIKFITYKEFQNNPDLSKKTVLLNNSHTSYLSGLNDNLLPYFVRHAASLYQLLFKDDKLNMAIYEINDLSHIDLTKRTIFYSLNDFETPVQYWKEYDISDDVKYAGNFSNKFFEYSSTLEYPIDSLGLQVQDKLIITCNLHCYFDNKTNSRIVISFENEEGSYIWRGFEIDPFIKAYSNWWQAKCEMEVFFEEFKENSVIKIYVWNEDKKIGYIDNFEIRMIKI